MKTMRKEKIYFAVCSASALVLMTVSAMQIRALVQTPPPISQIKPLPNVTSAAAIGDARNSLGKADAPFTLVEFADYECPACKPAHDAIKIWTTTHPDVRFVFRHFPLTEIHPYALIAAVAAEAAGEQGKFWPMHDLLYAHSSRLTRQDLEGYAVSIGLNVIQFHKAFSRRSAAVARVNADLKQASQSKFDGTPTLLWRAADGSVSSVAVTDLNRLTL